MAISLSRLYIDFKDMYQIELISGKAGLNKLVHWIHIIEDVEVPSFLKGDELVLTTGIVHSNVDWLLDFVRQLIKHHAVGLILNIGPYIKSVPQIVVDFCELNDFSLFTIPWKMHLVDVTYSFSRKIISSEVHETSLANDFKNMIFSPSSETENSLNKKGFSGSWNYGMLSFKILDGERILTSDDLNEFRLRFHSALTKLEHPYCVFVHSEEIVVVLSQIEVNEMTSIAAVISKDLNGEEPKYEINVGISNLCNGYRGLATAYKESYAALEASYILRKSILAYVDSGIYQLIGLINDKALLNGYANGVLATVEEYDVKNKTSYIDFIRTCLENKGSVNKISEALSVHRNTVNYRLRLLRELFGIQFSSEQIASLCLAFSIRKLLKKG